MISKHKTIGWVSLIWLFLAFHGYLSAQNFITVPGNFSSALYRPADRKLYAGYYEPSGSGWFGDGIHCALTVIDPTFGVIEQRVSLNKPIINMALTDDEDFVYFTSFDSIFRYNVDLGGIDLKFGIQVGPIGSNYLTDIATVPGKPNLLVATFGNGGSFFVVLYNNGVLQPDISQAFSNAHKLAVSKDGVHVFAYNNVTPTYDMFRLEITPNGIATLPETYNYIQVNVNFIQYFDGRLFGGNGTVIDIENGNQLRLGAHLNTGFDGYQHQMRVLNYASGGDTIYTHYGRLRDVYAQKFDAHNFQLLETSKLGSIYDQTGISNLISLGSPYAVAVLTYGHTLNIFHVCTSTITSVPSFPKTFEYGCLGDTLKLTAPGNFPEDRYFWSDGFKGKKYKRYIADETSFRLSYQVADQNGCLSPPSGPVEVKVVSPGPVVYFSHAGDRICAGGFVELTAISSGFQNLQGLEILWSNGQTGERIRVETPGEYFCQAISPEGCLSTLPPNGIIITASATPAPPQPTLWVEGGNGDEIFCSDEQNTSRLITDPGYEIYAWSDKLQFLDNTRAITSDGPISVQVQNAEGCRSEFSNTLVIQHFNTPPKPSIVRAENVMASSALTGNQWFLDGVAIPGATGQFFTATQMGSYTVQVTLNQNCPSPMSDPILF